MALGVVRNEEVGLFGMAIIQCVYSELMTPTTVCWLAHDALDPLAKVEGHEAKDRR